MEYGEFSDCLAWWGNRKVTNQAWTIKANDVLKYHDDGKLLDVNLDRKNPYSLEALEHLPPIQLIEKNTRKRTRNIGFAERNESAFTGGNLI